MTFSYIRRNGIGMVIDHREIQPGDIEYMRGSVEACLFEQDNVRPYRVLYAGDKASGTNDEWQTWTWAHLEAALAGPDRHRILDYRQDLPEMPHLSPTTTALAPAPLAGLPLTQWRCYHCLPAEHRGLVEGRAAHGNCSCCGEENALWAVPQGTEGV